VDTVRREPGEGGNAVAVRSKGEVAVLVEGEEEQSEEYREVFGGVLV
jgi:hypothetical protein